MYEFKNFVIKQFINNKNYGNLYLVMFKNKYIVVDPCIPFKEIQPFVENKKCVGVFLTHAHYDHFEEAQSYIDQNFTFYMHKNAKEKLINNINTCSESFKNANKPLFKNAKITTVNQNSIIPVDDIELKVEELFGHTDCSVGLIADNCFFVGDCIFEGGNIGRYDLATGSSIQTRTTLRKLKTMDLYLNVFSGHGSPFILKEFWNK